MRLAPAALAAALLASSAAIAQPPAPRRAAPARGPAATAPAPAPDRWHGKAREIYTRAVNTATVQGRGQVPSLAQYLQEQFRAAGITDATIHPYVVTRPDDHTAALIVRWPAAHPSGRKAILLMAHMDVVEARREDWSRDPFELGEADGYFYGRGSERRQGRRHRNHHRPAAAARRGLPAGPRHHRPLHGRRGDRRQRRAARRQ